MQLSVNAHNGSYQIPFKRHYSLVIGPKYENSSISCRVEVKLFFIFFWPKTKRKPD